MQDLKTIIENGKSSIDMVSTVKLLISCTDLTSLKATDNKESIDALCTKAINTSNAEKDIPAVAAVCVYPKFVTQVKENLQGTDIQLASVAGSFPNGQSPLDIRVAEVIKAVEDGADEIDMVISRGEMLAGNTSYISEEVAAIKKACGEAHLKVILETGELMEEALIREASQLSMEAGADFIKTSTGKVSPAATIEAFYYMIDEIRKYHEKTGRMVGIKPAGGISNTETAIEYFLVLKEVLGEKWLNNKMFRIGASSLLDDLLSHL